VDGARALENTVTVLVISCPHALGRAIPLVIALSARSGILIKDRLALERMRKVDTVLFDKTGTLTRGKPAVTGVAVAEGSDGDDGALLALAASVEADSVHPLARAKVTAAGERGLEVPKSSGFRSITGRGVEAAKAPGSGGSRASWEGSATRGPATDSGERGRLAGRRLLECRTGR
jgi:Cu2+-exporting ATPase